MSTKELDRARVVARVIDRRLSQRDAARQLGVTARTVRRLCPAYEAHGPAGLVSQSRGRRSNRQTPDELRRSAATLLTAHYADFGPTLATEKLVEVHGFEVSVPTVRKWMTELGLWKPRNRRLAIHQPRHRRPCRGEFIQIDGSDHNWFEDRAPRAGYCTGRSKQAYTLRQMVVDVWWNPFWPCRATAALRSPPPASGSQNAS